VPIFRTVVAMFAVTAILMITSPAIGWAIARQALAGASAAIIVPALVALVALVAENYHGSQQTSASDSLSSARRGRSPVRAPS